MKTVLLKEFEEYEIMNKKDIKGDLGNFNPTVMLPLIYNEKSEFR